MIPSSSHYGVPNNAGCSNLSTGSSSPQGSDILSLRSMAVDEDITNPNALINLQVFVPELQIQKCLTVCLDDLVWDIKRKLFESLPHTLPQSFNFGLFLPPCDGRAGKFLLEDRPIRDYPFHDCVPYVELKFKKRVYKMLKLDEKSLKHLHSKSNIKKFMDYISNRNAEKVEKMCSQGLDPNFHDSQGDTPLTLASGIPNNRDVLVQLVGGGAHLDFRNSEGQTGMHKAAFLSITDNVKTLLELGASPNYKDPIGLTPLYYNMLTADSSPEVAEMLLSEAADLTIRDMHANEALHQACKNGLAKHIEHLLYYGGNINVQNVNGNTPLHVCAVNNRPECARVLLFRGCDYKITNKQGQTALHVAHIVNNLAVAEVIQSHNPQNTATDYLTTPRPSTYASRQIEGNIMDFLISLFACPLRRE
ncbi:ankyrin repeats (3 copies) domain-containing protein [Ditylenchus destructor]|uniref:Ankyrin repeats (3 copies) domain-containing protein n=1 Tax=Ditylenchus destructor TaxID=166010 RepID=A0AAD4NAV3_9BILA|nr:ankyrin repeats (3 copies) domain-containing protein [Ditylenchus destructor]